MDKEQEVLQKLSQSAGALDEVQPPTPEFAHFKALVDRQQALVRRAQRIQLALFAAVALALVSSVVLLSGRFEAFFVALQAAALSGAIIGLALFSRKTRRQAEGVR